MYEEKKGSRSLFEVDLFEDTAELGSESEFGQDLQDIPTPTAVIEPPRQASEELIDFGIYRAADDDVADEDDVNVDDNIDKHQTPLTEDEISEQMNSCEEDDTCKFAPIVRFSFDVGTLTGPPTTNELKDMSLLCMSLIRINFHAMLLVNNSQLQSSKW